MAQEILPGGSLQGTMTQPQQQGSLTAFSSVMRAVSEDAYDYRKKKEGKVLSEQFDPTKVSGSIFKNIMGAVESRRGQGISKVYQGAVEAAKFDIQEKEAERQFNKEQENKKFDIIKQKTELGIDSVFIPTGSLADKNNNPGNLRFVGQSGASQGEGGFASFNTPEDGWNALQNQIRLDQSRGLTLAQFVNKYAPPTENDTNLYVQQMSQWLGVDPNVQLSSLDYEQVAEMVARKESGTQLVKASGGKDTEELDGVTYPVKTIAERKAFEDIKADRAKVESTKKTAISDFSNKLKGLDTILEDKKGLDRSVGTGSFDRGISLGSFYTDKNRSRFVAGVEQIVSVDSLNALIEAKAKGATFGALSDTEMNILKSSATKIGSWAIKNKDGVTIGYNVDEKEFKKELEILKENTEKALNNIRGSVSIGEIVERGGKRYKKVEGGWEEL